MTNVATIPDVMTSTASRREEADLALRYDCIFIRILRVVFRDRRIRPARPLVLSFVAVRRFCWLSTSFL
jgi:hypothetical protein